MRCEKLIHGMKKLNLKVKIFEVFGFLLKMIKIYLYSFFWNMSNNIDEQIIQNDNTLHF